MGHKNCAEYEYARDQVFRALVKAVSFIAGLTVKNADRNTGRVEVRLASSIMPEEAVMEIHAIEVTPRRTRISMSLPTASSAINGCPSECGISGALVEQIFSSISWNLNCDDRIEQIKQGTMQVPPLLTKDGIQTKSCGFWGGSTGGPR